MTIVIFSPVLTLAQRPDSLTVSSRPSFIDLNNAVTFEIAPHTGLMGKSGTFGLRLSMNYSSFNLELAGEQVIGKLANLYPLSVNAILNLSTRSRLIPYGAAGIGLLLTVPTATVGDETVSSIAINFGAGARYYFTKSFGIRAEVKQYITNVKNNRDLKDELLLFQEISLGVTFMVR
jgi:opacity protein-like surface antigen